MSKHTPGPWYWEQKGVGGDIYTNATPDGELKRVVRGINGRTDDEIIANHNLIATSPELFDVVQDLLNWNDYAVESDSGEWLAKIITKARAAADKAEGRQS